MEEFISPAWTIPTGLGFVGLGFAVLQVQVMGSSDEIIIAKGCFLLAAIIFAAQVFVWGTATSRDIGFRVTTCLILFGIIGWLSIESFRYLDRRGNAETKAKPTTQATGETPISSPPLSSLGSVEQRIAPMPKDTPTFREKVETITVSLGQMSAHYPIASMEKGQMTEPFDFGGYKPIRLFLDDGKLYADTFIYGGQDKPSIEIKHNEFTVRPLGWDRNFDSTAFEVVNSEGVPVFQLIYLTPYRINIYGIFPSPAGLMLANEDVFLQSAPHIPKIFSIRRLFQYPSGTFLGRRLEILPIKPAPLLKTRALALASELLAFVEKQEKIFEGVLSSSSDFSDRKKIYEEAASIYEEKFGLRCAGIMDEFAASGLNVGSLQAQCKYARTPYVMRVVAEKLSTFAQQLPISGS